VRLVIFEGGEPFLWRDGQRTVEDLVQAARHRGFFSTGITTNGTLPLESSADMVWVSIDGPREVHDVWRGPSYDRILTNIAASRHPRILANITIHRHNAQRIGELIRNLKGVVKGITIQFVYHYPDSEDLTVDAVTRRQILHELVTLKRQGYPLLDSYGVLRRLAGNTWRCHDWLIANVEPDGCMHYGCYLKGRGAVDCRRCGFAAHAELARAYDWDLAAIRTGQRVFGF
jgi:MoaA/NifB/PqqE/SkfB family radical SAM enzyme